tara:strand:+ start:197 stop:382 length:186 start_codon:yes stop_codon:yes gene_type:complete
MFAAKPAPTGGQELSFCRTGLSREEISLVLDCVFVAKTIIIASSKRQQRVAKKAKQQYRVV